MSFNPNQPSKPNLPGLPDLPGTAKPATPKDSALPGLPPLPTTPNGNNGGNNGAPNLPNLPNLPTINKPAGSPLPQQPVKPAQTPPAAPSVPQPAFKPVPTTPTQPTLPVEQPAKTPRFTQPSNTPVEPETTHQTPQYYEPDEEQFPSFVETQVEQPQETYSQQPVQVNQQQPVSNLRQPPREPDIEEETKGNLKRRSTSTKPNKKQKPARNVKGKPKEVKKTAFGGRRRNVIIARVIVFGIAGILMIAGVFSFLPKASGLTASDKPLILSAVRENINFTDFPRTAGEGFAQAFASIYLNYDPANTKERSALLENFVDPNVLTKIDTRPASPEEIQKATANSPGTPTPENATNGVQTVTDGPYIVGSLMYRGGNAAMFTIMAEINNNDWIFMQIPMYYNKTTGALSVSGSLTFAPPIETAKVPNWETAIPSWTDSDQTVTDMVKSDVAEYIKAWAASDTTNIERFLVKENGKVVATQAAREGLQGRYKLAGVSNINVEQKPALNDESTAEEKAAFYVRQADVTVTYVEPSSNMLYTQQYRLVLKYVNDDWFIEDINNISSLVDRTETMKREASAANKSSDE